MELVLVKRESTGTGKINNVNKYTRNLILISQGKIPIMKLKI